MIRVSIAILLICICLPIASAYNVVIDSSGISLDDIDMQIFEPTTINIEIHNNMNNDVDVTIDPNGLSLSPTSFTLGPTSSRTLELSVDDDVSKTIVYTASWTNTSKTATQDVTVDYLSGGLSISPEVSYTIEEGSYIRKDVTIFNTGDANLDVEVVYQPTDTLSFISPESFKLNSHSSRVVTYILYGHAGNTTVTYSYKYGTTTGSVAQDVHVTTFPSTEDTEMKEKLKILNAYDLNGSVSLETQNWKVGESATIRLKLDGDPVDALLRIKHSDKDYYVLVRGGSATFTPDSAGKYTVQVLNARGDIKLDRDVDVEKEVYNVSIGNQKINDRFTVELPEEGKLTIKGLTGDNKDTVVFEESGKDEYDVSIDAGGRYVAKFESNSYYGETEFTVKGVIVITAMVDGKTIEAGGKIPAGKNIVLQTTTASGTPVDGILSIAIPASAMGYSDQNAMWISWSFSQMAMMRGENVMPVPNSIPLKRPTVNGQCILPIQSSGKGVLIVSFPGDKYVEGSEVSYQIYQPFPSTWEHYATIIITAGTIIALIGIGVQSGRIKVPEKILNLRGGLRGKPPETPPGA